MDLTDITSHPPEFAASIVVVSDYNPATADRSWADERRCLAALAAQNVAEPFEIVISESKRWESRFPPDLLSIASNTRVSFSESETSYELKNAGARVAQAAITVILDADCQPSANWLTILIETMRRLPDVDVVSGRTVYEGESTSTRILALITRSYLDPGRAGRTRFIANNAAGFRSDVLRRHPLPENLGPFSARVQSEAMLREGHVLWFEPGLEVIHEFEGWPMEADIRRNIGYGTIATRLEHGDLPYARLVRAGPLALPFVWAGKLLNSWGDCLRCAPDYGVRWFELPLAMAASVAVTVLEIPGMIAGYRRTPISRTAYR
jgi:hypothetical protein